MKKKTYNLTRWLYMFENIPVLSVYNNLAMPHNVIDHICVISYTQVRKVCFMWHFHYYAEQLSWLFFCSVTFKYDRSSVSTSEWHLYGQEHILYHISISFGACRLKGNSLDLVRFGKSIIPYFVQLES